MQVITSLKKYGLTENEAKIYVALLKLIEAPAFQIALKSEVARGTVYHTLENLKHKGFVCEFKKGNVRYFTPESPHTLLNALKQKNEIIGAILPQLTAMQDDKGLKPDIALFFGKEGIKKVYNDILKTLKKNKEKRLLAISQPQIFSLLPKFFPKWIVQREKIGAFACLILPNTEKGHLLATQYKKEGWGEIRFLPSNYNWNGAINIYGEKIALFSFEKELLSAIIIENKVIAEMLRNFFKFFWENAKI
ncbi:MAG: helix-turn-helix domain-containing protein [bacterium]|nr:helix-turn-helix domain-containing protein [bacterium]